jgi:hypothetical protein
MIEKGYKKTDTKMKFYFIIIQALFNGPYSAGDLCVYLKTETQPVSET